jgi:5-methylcytosine-specific restriction endonuclease McrBC GTP-binding regulatory subunit McrB
LSESECLEVAQDILDGQELDASLNFDGSDQFVLIIDEINRGNISKILGELITLLEPSKRLTKDDELIVRLPYSGRAFGVPPNLHVIGTMNTADRSIALLDVALRRRFMFEEIMPNSDVLRAVLASRVEDHVDQPDEFVDLVVSVFEKINKRVQFLYDRDHMIGHAYYLQATDHTAFRDVLIKSVIPLLQEYFYGSWDLVCTALGCPYYEDGKARRSTTGYAYALVKAESSSQAAVLGFDHDDFEDKLEFLINPMFLKDEATPEDLEAFFKGIL